MKSLLLGSAAALLAVNANAADAIVGAEPESVEFVRVCDAYGAGFLYIPGTETCLSINGYVWYQFATNNQDTVDGTPPYTAGTPEAWTGSSRVRLNLDTRSDTEWGTLRGFIRLQGNWTSYNQILGRIDGPILIDQAFVELGGFRAGYTESAFNQTQYGGASNWGSHSWGGLNYAYQQRQLIAYSIKGGNGFHATLSIEDDNNGNYLPDAVVKAGVNQSWGSVWAAVGYDEDVYSNFISAGDSGFGVTAGVQVNIPNIAGSSVRVIGYYADSRNDYSVLGAEWSVLASYQQKIGSAITASIGAQYYNDFYGAGALYNQSTGINGWSGELSLAWVPVTNFEVRTEVNYDIIDGASGTTSGFLRFTRYF
jgi:hypothetical protein